MWSDVMDVQPVKNEDDYNQALAEIETLWGAEKGTADGDRLDILINLAEAYEDKHHQINAV